jgi:hypothetical protein
MRITKKQLQLMFDQLINSMRARCTIKLGTFHLDHNAIYGGYVIVCVYEGETAEYHPFGSRRLPARQMYDCMYMASTALQNYGR